MVAPMFNRINHFDIRRRLKLYLVMGSVNCLKDPAEVLQEAIQGGITIFQYREKGQGALEGQEKYNLAKKLQSLCKAGGIPFIVNDDVELALHLDADGVHVGQDDELASKVRRKIGRKILGVSAHNIDEAKQALEQGADYLGVGPMFNTQTKLDAREVQGPSLIQSLRAQSILAPLVGIGGISSGTAASVIHAGADGIAVVSAISRAESIRETVQRLLEEVNRA